MTVKYGFYDSLNGDRLYNADDINTFFEGVFSDGVFEFVGNGLKVENSPGTMNVLVKDGRAWFNNLWIRNTSTLTLTLQPSHMIYDRIDIVILEFDSSITVRENSIKILTGIPSSTPIPPVMTNTSTLNQYALAHIYVPAGVSEILMDNITNKIGTVNTPYAVSLISQPGTSDHGELTGLSDDDHPQYLTETRGNLLYPKDHGDLTGLGDDDHPQYLTQARGDILYPSLLGTQITLAHNATYSFAPPSTYGIILIQSRSASNTNYVFGFFSVNNSTLQSYNIGSNVEILAGVMPSPIAGTDTKLCVSVAATTGLIYIRNRTGSSRTIIIKII